jgi:hypothetical protein
VHQENLFLALYTTSICHEVADNEARRLTVLVLQIYPLSCKCPFLTLQSTKKYEFGLYELVKSMKYIVVCCVSWLAAIFGHFECHL